MEADTELCAKCGATNPRATTLCVGCGDDPRLDGRYRLLAQLGHGAFGTTYRAERASDGQQFAVKELLVRRLQDFKAHDLFMREAEMLSSLRHPGIPRYVDHFTAGEGRQIGLYLVVELVDGRTLSEEVRSTRIDQRQALVYVRELCDILAYLHGLSPPVVHRDLKPDNIMVRRDGRLVLVDFGAVKDVVRAAEPGSTVAGTFGYMAPEQLAGRATAASDIYALGVTLVELATRQPPMDLLDEQNRLRWEAFFDDGPVKDLLTDMLATEVARRLDDVREVARRIDDILEDRARPRAAPPQRTGSAGASLRAQHPHQVAALLRALGIDAAPGSAEPPPPAPRPLPRRFVKTVDPFGHFFTLFGVLFGLPAVIAIAAVASVLASNGLGDGFAPFLLPFLLFPAIGTTFFLIGRRRASRFKRIYREGRAAEAVVVESGLDGRLRVNGRSPFAISFEFADDAGTRHVAKSARFQIRPDLRVPGARVWALYDPAKPETAMLWPV